VSVLRPITDAEYAVWLETVIPGYAEDKVASGQWPAKSALELSRREYAELLPKGKDTENNYIFTVLGAGGEAVGTLWFVTKERANRSIAYVYDIFVSPEHRRQGHALRAFQALETQVASLGLSGIALHVFGHNHEAQALYFKLGYVATNINMFKSVAAGA
jgi:ribosomal protein S18 acetylase RimI-like enzyme